MKDLVKAFLSLQLVAVLLRPAKKFHFFRQFLNFISRKGFKYHGVYESMEQARADLPRGAKIGYDHEEVATVHIGYTHKILSSDYPVLFWLARTVQEHARIFDFGGNLGNQFYTFEKYLEFPKDFIYLVCDVPAVVQAGRELAEKKGETRLRFVDDFELVGEKDILFSSGTLQYIPKSLGELLQNLPSKPKWLLLNRLPVNDQFECVTIQNTGKIIAPYRVFQGRKLISEIESNGYKLVDFWQDSSTSCFIPFYPEYSVKCYSGMYFIRK